MHTRRLALLAAAVLVAAFLAGCSCHRCERERDRFLADWGEPQDKQVEKVGHIITETWFYWEANSSIVFLWDDRDCGCDVSTYRFAPDGVTRELSFRTADPHPFGP